MKMILIRNGVHYPLSVSSVDGDTLYLRDDIDAIYNDGDILSLGRDDSSKVLAIYKCSCVNNKDLVGSITYTEEITPKHESGLNSINVERYYCVKLHNNKKQQEIRFFTGELYVEDIISVMKILKTN